MVKKSHVKQALARAEAETRLSLRAIFTRKGDLFNQLYRGESVAAFGSALAGKNVDQIKAARKAYGRALTRIQAGS